MSTYRVFDNHFLKACLAAVFAVALTACSSSSDSPSAMPDPDPTPTATAYETAKAAIAVAETAEAAQAAVATAVAAGITGAQLQSLNMAVAERTTALAEMKAAADRQMLVDAAMCDDATAECIAAHTALIEALQADVDALAEDEDATNAQQTAAQMALDEATETRNELRMQLTEIDRSTATGSAVGAAVDAANGLETARTAADIEAAEMLLATAKAMLTDADDYATQITAAEMAIARAKARNTVDAAVMAATGAASGLTEDSDADAVTAAQGLIDAARMAVADAEHLTDEEKADHNATITSDERLVTLARNRNDDAADEQRMAEEEEQRKANEAMAATAAKLFAGLEHGLGDTNNVRTGASDTDGVISVTIGTAAAVPLAEDKKTTVADLHGWEGKKHTAEPTGDAGTYEARVYSDVRPTEGRKFGSAAAVTATGDFEYELTAASATNPGELAITGDTAVATRIDSSSFDQSAGTKEFKLPTNTLRVSLSGTYHGVSGTYYCTPAAASTCASRKAAEGFDLGSTLDADNVFTAGGWTFKPSDPNAKVMDMADTVYASYGWWIHTSEDGNTYTASAFETSRGTVPAASALDTLQGTATYVGGAAGKYALSSATGGTNDAGHFTARATLNADFSDDSITGTIDGFMDGDGNMKDWSVELKEAAIAATGEITRTGTGEDGNDTVWTIDSTAAVASGVWSGTLYDNGDDGVPKVGTGTFYTEYGTSGKMVGAFGVNKQ